MPKGPNGQKRPADAIGLAVMVGRIATGEIEDSADETLKRRAATAGRKGGPARAVSLTPEQRSEIARAAANARCVKRARRALRCTTSWCAT
jgi:hypothetical protein